MKKIYIITLLAISVACFAASVFVCIELGEVSDYVMAVVFAAISSYFGYELAKVDKKK